MSFRSFWRPLVALFFLMSLPLVLGCGGKKGSSSESSDTTLEVKGKVTYVRIPLLKDSAGRPTGLETDSTKFLTKPARGVRVRAIKSTEESMPDGTKVTIWADATGYVFTDVDGAYSFRVPKDTPAFIEVDSVFYGGSTTRLIADPAGIESSVHITERAIYSVRKGLDGTSPAGNPTPTTKSSANVTVDFSVGLNETWWLGPEPAKVAPSAVQETSGTGSRVLAIGDTIYSFQAADGTPTPPSVLQLHYKTGLSHPRGSFVNYDIHAYEPLNNSTYFGSIRGKAENDDAFDEGVLFPLLARNCLVSQGKVSVMPLGTSPADVNPDVALLEGLPDAMAGVLLKSPYLADTYAGGIHVRDIHDLPAIPAEQRTPYGAANLAALAWELIFKAQGLTLPGTSTDWDKLDPLILWRFFALTRPLDTDSIVNDIPSAFSQIARLQEDKGTSETVDLKTIFTNDVLTPMLAPFGIPWPRPTTGPLANFMQDWGSDPNSLAAAIPSISMSMANAAKVENSYPNLSHGEMVYARFKLTKDTAYKIRVIPSVGTLPQGAHLELNIGGGLPTLEFTGAEDPADPKLRHVLTGNSTTPVWYYVRLRLISPDVLVPDFNATVRLDVVQ